MNVILPRNGRIFVSGNYLWYKDGILHREDGPAIVYAVGTKYWFINGKLHRVDGPAIEWTDGTKMWYLDGEQIECNTNKKFLRIVKLKAFW